MNSPSEIRLLNKILLIALMAISIALVACGEVGEPPCVAMGETDKSIALEDHNLGVYRFIDVETDEVVALTGTATLVEVGKDQVLVDAELDGDEEIELLIPHVTDFDARLVGKDTLTLELIIEADDFETLVMTIEAEISKEKIESGCGGSFTKRQIDQDGADIELTPEDDGFKKPPFVDANPFDQALPFDDVLPTLQGR